MRSNKLKCKNCTQYVWEIGPFASLKREGEPAAKYDGQVEIQCTNPSCSEYGIKKKIKPWDYPPGGEALN